MNGWKRLGKMKKRFSDMKKIRKVGLAVMVSALLVIGNMGVASCRQSEEEQLTEVVDSFSATYFNWQFHRSVAFCTPESRRWLSYMASQVGQRDVDRLRAHPEGAAYEIGEVAYTPGISTATAVVTVSHFLAMDTIGAEPQLVERAWFAVPLVLRGGRWRVSLSEPLRPQKD